MHFTQSSLPNTPLCLCLPSAPLQSFLLLSLPVPPVHSSLSFPQDQFRHPRTAGSTSASFPTLSGVPSYSSSHVPGPVLFF